MKRRTTELVAGIAILLLITTGCAGLSTAREELALQEMAKRAYSRCNGHRPSGLYSRDFERGWRQAYYTVSRGGDVCPPSVPPEVYWSTRYQNGRGCKSISAWYQGYNAGAATAVAECRPGFSKVPVMANCVREKAMQCSPVQPLRHPEIGEVFLGGTSPKQEDIAGLDSMWAELPLSSSESHQGERPSPDNLVPVDLSPEVDVQKLTQPFASLNAEAVRAAEDYGPELEAESDSRVVRTSFPTPVRLPVVD